MPLAMHVLESTRFGSIFSDVIHNSTFEGVFCFRDLVAMALDENFNGIALATAAHDVGLTAVIFVEGSPECVMMLDNHGSFLLDRAGAMLEEMGTFELFGVDAQSLKNHRNRHNALIGAHASPVEGKGADLRDEVMRLSVENARLRRNEAHYRTLVEDARSIVIRIDRQGYILFVNEYGRVLFGLRDTPGGFHVGTICQGGGDPDEDFCARIAGILAVPDVCPTFECRHAVADGSTRRIAWTSSVRQSPTGAVESVLCTGTDITDRRAGRGDMERARMLLEHAPNMVLVNHRGKVVYANRQCEKILGYSQDELCAPSFAFQDLLAPEDAGAMAVFEETGDCLCARAVECTLLAKDGHRLDAIFSGQFIPYEGERALLGMITDITGRKESEGKLLQSRQLYRAIFETTGTATMIVEEDGSVLLANAEFERMFGYTQAELEGSKGYKKLFEGEDLGKVTRYHLLRRHSPDQAPRSYEANLVDAKGRVRSVFITVSLIPGTARSVVSLMDITDRRRAEEGLREKEEWYRIIAENAKDVIWTMDLGLRFTYVSPSVLPLLGYTTEEILANSIDLFLSESAVENIRRVLLEQCSRADDCGDHDETNNVLELECSRSDGSPVWVETKVSYLRDSERRPIGLVGVARDIGERKEVERIRREALDQIEKNMEQFAILNDHIRNPLQAIVGMVDLEGGPLAEKVVSQAAEIDAIIKQLDIGWLESKKISDFLRKHYKMP
ncbi:MAG: PAS domain S-box protein [Methanomicrobiaceae archaeon]|nr:PAS domain S-box protein [Methanomicrobiaceae archaeon]